MAQFHADPRNPVWRASRGLAPAAALVAAIMAFSTPGAVDAQEANQWNRHKGDCEYVIKAPDRYPLPSLEECVVLWEQYKDVSRLSPDERNLYVRGPSWLFLNGNLKQKAIAKGALTRMGIPDPWVLRGGKWYAPGGGVTKAIAKLEPLPRVHVTPASKGAAKKAKRANNAGYKKYKRKKYGSAIEDFKKALSSYEFDTKARYNMACNLALLGDADGALNSLLILQSWDSGEAAAAFRSARVERDFKSLHSDARFRQLVGLVRISILNGAAEPGLYHVARIRKAFMDRKMYVAQYGYDRHVRKRPLVYYRKGYEAQRDIARSIVNNVRTANKEINWESPFDLIVVWGDPDVAERASVGKPLVHGHGTVDSSGSILDQAKGAKGKVDDATGTAKDTAKIPGQ